MKKLFSFLLLLLCGGHIFAQEPRLEVEQLAPRVWGHTSFRMLGTTKFPSNGLIVSTTEGVLLIDTAWGEAQTEQLLQWVKQHLQQPVKQCLVTHAHDDRMGGIKVLQQAGVQVLSSAKTAELAAELALGNLLPVLPPDTTIVLGQQQLQVYYPGAGHAPDNLVVYLPEQQLLFGGCLVKHATAKSLGNTADADLRHWPYAIRNVQQKFPKAKLVVPGHGSGSSPQALAHTLHLLEQVKGKHLN